MTKLFQNLNSFIKPKQTSKHLLTLLAAILLLAGCRKVEGVAKVRIHVDGFSVSQEEIPEIRAAIADYTGVSAITLAFYNGSTEVTQITQLRSDNTTYTTFGEFDLSLPMGSYTMVVLGYGFYEGDEFTLTSPTQAAFTGDVRETFATTQAVNITSTDAVNISTTLDRIVPRLKVISTDGKTANASKVRMTFSAGGKAFNPTTGLATANSGTTSTVGISAAVGATSTSLGYAFLVTDEQTMTVTLDVLDADGNSISHKVVNNVPFQRNRCTKLTGSLYNAGTTGSFSINTEWLDGDNEVGF